MVYLDSNAGNAGQITGYRSVPMLFTEVGAGTYAQSVTVPAGALLRDIVVVAVAAWDAATSASLQVGDGVDPDGYFTAVDLKATDLTIDQGISFALQGGVGGAYMVSTHTTNIYDSSARVVTASVTSVGAGTAGRTLVVVTYEILPTPTAAVFTAA